MFASTVASPLLTAPTAPPAVRRGGRRVTVRPTRANAGGGGGGADAGLAPLKERSKAGRRKQRPRLESTTVFVKV